MIEYLENCDRLTSDMLIGFFEGWPQPPDPKTHLKLLKQSSFVVLAFDTDQNKAVGFINAVSDKVLSAYIPLLEVLPEYRKRGIAGELVKRMLAKLSNLYDISLICDKDLNSFYERFNMKPYNAMIIRNYSNQNGSN